MGYAHLETWFLKPRMDNGQQWTTMDNGHALRQVRDFAILAPISDRHLTHLSRVLPYVVLLTVVPPSTTVPVLLPGGATGTELICMKYLVLRIQYGTGV